MNFPFPIGPRQSAPLLVVLVFFGGSLWFSQKLAHSLAKEAQQTVTVWAEAYRRINTAAEDDPHLDFFARIIKENNSIPMVILDEHKTIVAWRNIDSTRIGHAERMEKWLEKAAAKHPPIRIDISNDQYNLIYYGDSQVLRNLALFPYLTALIIALFAGLAQWMVHASRKAQENRLWVGLSKETAHQLGTPISSLMVIRELLQENPSDPRLLEELGKDVERLESITERFSKIGSRPALQPVEMNALLQKCVDYISTRSPKGVPIRFSSSINPAIAPIDPPLFEWVIENLCKNALDALKNNPGNIEISLSLLKNNFCIDITDTGKGIPRKDFHAIFRPGFTTKTRGWGLGLTLAKRVIEEYHNGRIFVHRSELDKGTTFRITIPV